MTNMNQAEGSLLKTNAVGHVMTPQARRESLLEEFNRSGLSGAEFARVAGIKYKTFYAWISRRRKQKEQTSAASPSTEPVKWFEAVITQAQSSGGNRADALRVGLHAGAWMEVVSVQQVPLAAALIQALERRLPSC